MEKEYVIEPALGPKTLDGINSRPGTAGPVPLGHKRKFGSPVRPPVDVSQSNVGQSRPPAQTSVSGGVQQQVIATNHAGVAEASMEPSVEEYSAHVATPPAAEYPVAPDDPMLDESPESAFIFLFCLLLMALTAKQLCPSEPSPNSGSPGCSGFSGNTASASSTICCGKLE